MGRDSLINLIELINEGMNKAYNGSRYDEASVLYDVLEDVKKELDKHIKIVYNT